MSVLALELHDVESIAISDGAADVAQQETVSLPAVVRLDGAELLVGEAALEGARYLPRQVHDRFYEELSTEPLGRPFPAGWRAADLAHAHLELLRRRLESELAFHPDGDELILLTGGLDEDRLPLLLGIAASLGLRVAGLVPSGLAATAGRRGVRLPERSVHLELYRHRAVATYLRCRDGHSGVEDSVIDKGISWTKLRAAQLDAVARAFLRSTRYDPLGTAEGEQQLHDRLPGWLEALGRRPEVDARLGRGAAVASIELSRDELEEAVAPLAARLAELAGDAEKVLLGPSATALGVPETLRSAGLDVDVLSAGDASRGALAAAGEIRHAGPGLLLMRLRSAAT